MALWQDIVCNAVGDSRLLDLKVGPRGAWFVPSFKCRGDHLGLGERRVTSCTQHGNARPRIPRPGADWFMLAGFPYQFLLNLQFFLCMTGLRSCRRCRQCLQESALEGDRGIRRHPTGAVPISNFERLCPNPQMLGGELGNFPGQPGQLRRKFPVFSLPAGKRRVSDRSGRP